MKVEVQFASNICLQDKMGHTQPRKYIRELCEGAGHGGGDLVRRFDVRVIDGLDYQIRIWI